MHNKLFLFIALLLIISCNNKDNNINLSESILNEYLLINNNRALDEVIACAGNNESRSEVYIYYYPITGSSEIRYYETETTSVNPNDFSNYKLQNLPTSPVFGGKLSRFTRTAKTEAWGIVTFITEGKIHKSNPIRLKQTTKPTLYTDRITIRDEETTMPKFSWNSSVYNDDAIYFQALVNNSNTFISGTYTVNKCFRYYDTTNVVLNINQGRPESFNPMAIYTMNILGVSKDNWVNIHARKTF